MFLLPKMGTVVKRRQNQDPLKLQQLGWVPESAEARRVSKTALQGPKIAISVILRRGVTRDPTVDGQHSATLGPPS